MPLFGTSGIRGDSEKLFTEQFCFDIGRTFAQFLTKHKQIGAIAIGMDPRTSSPRIKGSLIKGINYEGREVFDEGATPVPSMCYLLQIDPSMVGSIMVTGSHIKANLNGVKFFAFREEIYKKHEVQIEQIYESLKEKVKPSNKKTSIVESLKAGKEYKELLRQIAVKPYPNWKIVVDAGDGAQSDTISVVLKELGITVIEQNTTIQGEFMARDTENKEDFKMLCERVLQEKVDFGIGFDADGDRAIFVDSKGNFIPGDYTCSLIAKEAQGEFIITPVTTSTVVEHIGKKIVRTKVGSPYVIEGMKKVNAKFGFEANGGGVSSEIMYTRDGGTTALKLLNILAKNKITLEEAVDSLPKYYLNKTKMDYKWEQKETIVNAVKLEFKGIKTDEMDGLKIWTDENTWILFRSSNNAPEFRIFAESTDRQKSEDLLKKGADFVREIISKS